MLNLIELILHHVGFIKFSQGNLVFFSLGNFIGQPLSPFLFKEVAFQGQLTWKKVHGAIYIFSLISLVEEKEKLGEWGKGENFNHGITFYF